MSDTESVFAATARVYARSDFHIFPIWWITDDGRCACPAGRIPETQDGFCGRTSTGVVRRSPGKHPITSNGVKAATNDPRWAAHWWSKWPNANIGIAAGASGFAVIDVDPAHGGEDSLNRLTAFAETRGIDLLDTMTARTGSGGLHLYYAAPVTIHAGPCPGTPDPGRCDGIGCIRNGQGNKPPFGSDMPGLDTRGFGGYVVAPPSAHVSGSEYDWINFGRDPAPWPPLLSRVIESAYPKPKPPTAAPVQASGAPRYAQVALEREVEALLSTGEGGRNGQLNRAAFSLGQLVAGGSLTQTQVEDALTGAARSIGLDDTEIRKTLESGLTSGRANPRQGAQ
jgi:hypothetical protein